MTNKNIFPDPETVAMNILEMTAITGELPADQLVRLVGGDSYKLRVITKLKKDGLLKTYYRDHLRAFRLTSLSKDFLLKSNPERFSNVLKET